MNHTQHPPKKKKKNGLGRRKFPRDLLIAWRDAALTSTSVRKMSIEAHFTHDTIFVRPTNKQIPAPACFHILLASSPSSTAEFWALQTERRLRLTLCRNNGSQARYRPSFGGERGEHAILPRKPFTSALEQTRILWEFSRQFRRSCDHRVVTHAREWKGMLSAVTVPCIFLPAGPGVGAASSIFMTSYSFRECPMAAVRPKKSGHCMIRSFALSASLTGTCGIKWRRSLLGIYSKLQYE